MLPAPLRPPARIGILGLLATLVALLSLGAAPLARAEGRPQTRATAGPDPAIAAARAAIETSALDDAQRELALGQLAAAESLDREAADWLEKLAALREESSSWPQRTKQLQAELEVDRDRTLQAWAARLPEDADGERLEQVLEQTRAVVMQQSAQIDATEDELSKWLARPVDTASELARLQHRAEELAAPIDDGGDEPGLVSEARRLRNASERRRVEAELELRRVEQETGVDRQRLHELELRVLRQRRALDTRRAELLQTRIADRTRGALEARVERLKAQDERYADRPGVEADAARENRILGEELLEENERLADDRAELAALAQARDQIAVSLRDSRARLELGEMNEAVGRWIWSQRRRLEPPARLRRRLATLRGELATTRLRRLTLGENLLALEDIPAAALAMHEASQREAEGDEARTIAAKGLEPLLRERVDLLEQLEPILQRRITTLEQNDQTLLAQLESTTALQQLLDRYLLWTPSHTPIDLSWIDRVPEGLSDLLKPARYVTTWDLVVDELSARPVRWAASVLLLVILVELRRRAPRRIEAQAAITKQIREDHFGATLETFAWTLLAAAPGPFAFWLLGELLKSSGSPGRFSDSLGRTCGLLVLPLFAVQALSFAVVEGGLAHAHFRWMRARRAAIRRVLPWTAAIVLPMYFISLLAFIRNLDLPNDVQARTAIVIASLALAWAFWRLLEAGQVWVHRGVESEPSTARTLLRAGLPIGFVVVAGLSLAGYVYSAGLLLQGLINSFNTVVAVAIGVGLLARWFLLGERRLALRRIEERRAAAAAATESPGDAPLEVEADLSLERVNAQTRSLLRVVRIGLLGLGLIGVWAGVLPAVTRLDEIELWSVADVAADGSPTRLPVSLMAALLGTLTLGLTFVSSRNLPGLLEVGLQSQTRIDAASRYAITSILRYVLVIAGTLVGLNLLGMRWSQLQWMAAALTVGLGFGLQEIFANFVSGLILLFERPFRVGDIITVADLSGRVTRIRTRATTILDFDNKEIVVPNKSFITGQLVNWTLTDTTTRIVIKVTVDYGSDPNRVNALLMQAARENPLVLGEPEPQSWFVGFGASDLLFELRAFVGTIGDRQPAQSGLNLRIAELFAEHGIAIPYTQLDVHVRELPALKLAPPDAPNPSDLS